MSSKKPTVVDSWEEIDEDRLPGSISILKNTGNNSPPQKEGQSAGSNTTARQSTLPEMLEEELKPKMVARPMQILRRPQSDAGDGKSSAESKPKAQVKSLDQRQKEYAEARLRILGSAHDDGEETETKKTNPPANGYRTNASNNNTTSNSSSSCSSSSSSSSSNVTKSGGCSTSGAGLVPGGSANNNGANYRFHAPPYRQQQPASLGAFQASGVQPAAGGAMFFASSPPLPLPHTPNHPAMHGAHPALHLPHHSFSHAPPHPYQQQQQQQHQQQQHFAQHLNSPQPPHMFVGGSGRGGSSASYYSKGVAYGEVNGAPMMPLLGHAPPGHLGAGPYVGGAGYGVGSPNGPVGGVKAGSSGPPNGSNQHLLRLPAGPDGSQGFNMRR